jgi:hypothetical protein
MRPFLVDDLKRVELLDRQLHELCQRLPTIRGCPALPGEPGNRLHATAHGGLKNHAVENSELLERPTDGNLKLLSRSPVDAAAPLIEHAS